MTKNSQELNVASTEPVEISIDDKKKNDVEKVTTTEDDSKLESESKTGAKAESTSDSKIDLKHESKDDSKDESESKSNTEKLTSSEPKIEAKSDIQSETPPPQPPRPKDPIQQITKDLKEAFPNIEEKYITAVLIASQGNADLSFNALLYISDPSYKPEISVQPPPLPLKSNKDLTDDELLARKLQKEFELEDQRRRRRDQERRRRERERQPEEDESDEFSEFKQTFQEGFTEAKETISGWVSGLAKKFDQPQPQQKQDSNPQLFGALGGSSFNNKGKSARFDEDPEIISNDFHDRIKLTDNDLDDSPSLPKRKPEPKKWQSEAANSDAFLVTDSEDEDVSTAAATTGTEKK